MNWNSLAEFIDMGGYALYVWGSFVMAGAVLAWEALMLAQRRHHAIEALRDHRAQARHGQQP